MSEFLGASESERLEHTPTFPVYMHELLRCDYRGTLENKSCLLLVHLSHSNERDVRTLDGHGTVVSLHFLAISVKKIH